MEILELVQKKLKSFWGTTNMSTVFESYLKLLSLPYPELGDPECCFNSGVSLNEINVLQSHVGKRLPLEFVELYQKYNGECDDYLNFIARQRFLPIDEVQHRFDDLVQFDKSFVPVGTSRISSESSSKNKWIPFAADGLKYIIAIDLTPAEGLGKVGQVILLKNGPDGPTSYLMADNLIDFFEKLTKLSKNAIGEMLVENTDFPNCEYFFDNMIVANEIKSK